MFTASVKVKSLKPRVDVFTKKLHENMIKLWNNATKEFIRVAAPAIHVDTGMSRASLIPLARLVRMVTVVRDFTPQRTKAGGYTDLSGTYHATPKRSIALGERFGQKAFKLNYGSKDRPVFKFQFDIAVYQHMINEDNWQALEKGQDAFIQYINDNALRVVPDLAEWIFPETRE